jgi:hypothetical protein
VVIQEQVINVLEVQLVNHGVLINVKIPLHQVVKNQMQHFVRIKEENHVSNVSVNLMAV